MIILSLSNQLDSQVGEADSACQAIMGEIQGRSELFYSFNINPNLKFKYKHKYGTSWARSRAGFMT